MAGCFDGLRVLVQHVAPNVRWTHCLIHRPALALQQLKDDLNVVFEIVVKIVNFIKTRSFKALLFHSLCDESEAKHNNLLFYCNSRRLSKGKFLFCVYQLRNQII